MKCGQSRVTGEPLAVRLGASGAEALLHSERQHGQSRVTGKDLRQYVNPERPAAFRLREAALPPDPVPESGLPAGSVTAVELEL